jgi:hypothetical protein
MQQTNELRSKDLSKVDVGRARQRAGVGTMTTRKRNWNRNWNRNRNRKGLVLLMALGMLALFSLLAVTWVVSASSSRTGAQAMRVRANHSGASVRGMSEEVLKMALRGTRDQKSAFHQHGLLEDIYDSKGIRLQFGHRFYLNGINAFQDRWCKKLTPANGVGVELVKISLNPNAVASGNVPLSPIEGAYNGRVMTVLEGPLTGQSFRIVKYVGYVPSVNDTTPDPNISGGTPLGPTNTYSRSDATDYDYSIVLDLSTAKGKLEGRWKNPNNGMTENFSGELGDWIGLPNNAGLRNLFFFYDPASQQYQGYRCLINGAAFNNAAIGMETRTGSEGFGNIDGKDLMKIPVGRPKVSPALLPNYDYLQSPDYMVTNADGTVGVSGISDLGLLKGQSNEGIDVPDWRDFWLSHDTYVDATTRRIIPSFHRPELINYLANLYGAPSNAQETSELLRWVDASTARVMSYAAIVNGQVRAVNPNFKPHAAFPSYTVDSLQSNSSVVSYLQAMIEGAWDVDNDGDGIADSVWINPNLPAIHAPDGRLLKPLVAIKIQDLDGYMNVNLHGDRIQGTALNNPNGGGIGFNAMGGSGALHRFGMSIPQGFGYGPADISLNPLFGTSTNPGLLLLTSPNSYSIFDLRYGAKPYANQGFNPQVDRWPGVRLNDPQSALSEREIPLDGVYRHGRMPGAPLGRRTAVASAFDKHGNLTFLNPDVQDVFPEGGVGVGAANEAIGDAYESGSGRRNFGDTPFTISDLEPILRRYDEDVEALPSVLRDRLRAAGVSNSSEINKLITTMSAELRYPKLAAAATIPDGNGGYMLEKDAGNLLGLIRMMHEQRYRKRTLPSPQPTDEFPLTMESLSELFPPEFSSNLRLNLNRAFGNGRDDAFPPAKFLDSQIDEPSELFLSNEREVGSFDSITNTYQSSAVTGYYRRGLNERSSASRSYFGSRQLLARYLYCLGQLIIPRDYKFPAMLGVNNQLLRDRIRARAIAQWAVNVVDFRDTDAAMTRFEYDIYPFGVRNVGGIGDRPAYWAPDRLINPNDGSYNGSVRNYVDVVWGMEQPELLLTESLAFHDKRIRDTDLDPAGKLIDDAMNPDRDYDQYRFPQGSLFLEMYATRSTYVANDPVLPGAPSSLYQEDPNASGRVKLDLSRRAPESADWGRQPVWRIGISNSTPPDVNNAAYKEQPNVIYQTADTRNGPNRIHAIDPQVATSSDLAGVVGTMPRPEDAVGSGLFRDSQRFSTNAEEFDRLVWFLPDPGNSLPRVPNLRGNNGQGQNGNLEHLIYYNRSINGQVLLEGGNYLVVGPRRETNVGSLTANPTNGAGWPEKLRRQDLALPNGKPIHSPSHQMISLDVNNITTNLLNGESIFRYRTEWSPALKAPVGIVCAAVPPQMPGGNLANVSWNVCFPDGIGLNVSMPNPIPNQGYWRQNNIPEIKLNTDDRQNNRSDQRFGFNDLPPDSWIDTKQVVTNLPDKPFDYDATTNPILFPAMKDTGTYENARTAYLQRLADPEMPYHPINNPYITVDWISIDLTVFNGEAPANGKDPDDTAREIAFQSRYKDGGMRKNAPKKSNAPNQFEKNGQPKTNELDFNNLTKEWGISYHSVSTAELRKTIPQNPSVLTLRPAANGPQKDRYPSYFMHQLGYASQQPDDIDGDQPKHCSASTLGYLNVGYHANTLVVDPAEFAAGQDSADKYDGFGPPQLVPSQPDYNGSPRDLTSPVWFNRTYANAHELMLVPMTSAGQFGSFFSTSDSDLLRTPFEYLPSFQSFNGLATDLANVGSSDFLDYVPTNNTQQERESIRLGGYWLRRSGDWPGTVRGGIQPPVVQADWGMLLELVETPPVYVDTVKRLDVTQVEAAANADAWAARFLASYVPPDYTNNGEGASFRGSTILAPMHQLPSYVSPGKINLNTIPMQQGAVSHVFQGLEYLYESINERTSLSNALTRQFFITRRGYQGTSSTWLGSFTGMDPNYPTMFAGAYRSGLSTNLYPYAPHNASTVLPQVVQRGRYAGESTVLRSLDPDSTALQQENGPSQGTLLFSPYSIASLEQNGFPNDNLELVESKQNAFIRYQRAMRLSNLTTDQSNIFAVWITVGLFEYDPATGFGREYVNLSGEAEREKSFYVIDRTVPVGFIPGEDLNTDRAVLLRRTINSKRR